MECTTNVWQTRVERIFLTKCKMEWGSIFKSIVHVGVRRFLLWNQTRLISIYYQYTTIYYLCLLTALNVSQFSASAEHHGDVVMSTVASQQEGSWVRCLQVCKFSTCLRGLSLFFTTTAKEVWNIVHLDSVLTASLSVCCQSTTGYMS